MKQKESIHADLRLHAVNIETQLDMKSGMSFVSRKCNPLANGNGLIVLRYDHPNGL